MKGMLAMAQIEYIKHLRENEGCSIQEIAERVAINWRTAKKYADCLDWNESNTKRKHPHRVMDPFIEIVDAWLIEDQTKPRKQRHTAKRVYDRLKAEYGFQGSDRTVRAYVSKRKKELKIKEMEPYVKLEHPEGEAQVDFGEVYTIENGKEMKRHQLVVSFPFSNTAFPYILPGQNIECFLEGLKQIFERIGGVPKRLWFDNLSAAVVSVQSEGKRVLTDAFQRFKLHYRFEATFCNPGKGNEKGHVENKVGYTRRNWCVPVPIVENLEELQKQLNDQAVADMDRLHYEKKVMIRELWEQEKPKLLQLPATPFDVVRLDQVRVNKYGQIKLDGESIDLSNVQPGDVLMLKIRWNRAEIIDANHQKITEIPRPYMNQGISIDWKHHLRVFRAKPRSLPYASIFKCLPSGIQTWILDVGGDERRSRISWMMRILESYELETIAAVLEKARGKQEDFTQLEHALYTQIHPELSFQPIAEPYTPSSLVGWEPDIAKYDVLHRQVVSQS